MILPLASELKPRIFVKHWRILQADKRLQVVEKARCAQEPWYWLVNYVYTVRKDENVVDASVERFPADEYLRYTFHKLFTEPLFAADKSRQMRLTFLLMAYAIWKCQYREHQEIVVQTKKEADAHEQLLRQRAYVIWRYQPSYIRDPIEKDPPAFCRIYFPGTDSLIKGIPKGADQIRSCNPTTTILDEGGFFEGDFEECRTAALACCKDVKCVSTANGGEWDDFINDKMVA